MKENSTQSTNEVASKDVIGELCTRLLANRLTKAAPPVPKRGIHGKNWNRTQLKNRLDYAKYSLHNSEALCRELLEILRQFGVAVVTTQSPSELEDNAADRLVAIERLVRKVRVNRLLCLGLFAVGCVTGWFL